RLRNKYFHFPSDQLGQRLGLSASGTINRAASAIIVMLQRTTSPPHTIIDATPAIIFGLQIIVSEVQIIVSAIETVISSDHQTTSNQAVSDVSQEITISAPETIIDGAEASNLIVRIIISKRKAMLSELNVHIAGPCAII